MVNLVQISRAYDANQHVITTDKQMQKELDALG
jgi:flagellar basal body rod protein FlgG